MRFCRTRHTRLPTTTIGWPRVWGDHGWTLDLRQDPCITLHHVVRNSRTRIKSWEVTQLNGPKHGDLIAHPRDSRGYIYQPKDGYLGPDQMIFLVEAKGKKFKVIYSVDVADRAPEYGKCPDSFNIKELPNPSTRDQGSCLDILELPTDGPVSPEKLAEFHAALSFSFGFGFLGLTGLLGFARHRRIRRHAKDGHPRPNQGDAYRIAKCRQRRGSDDHHRSHGR